MAKVAKKAAVKAPKTKSQIMAAIAEQACISKKQAKEAVDALLAVAYAGAKGKTGFVIPGLGKLIKVQRKARMGRNPATGQAIKIPAKTVVKFRLAKAAKEAVLS
jgi:DNA-binding protein HU-beta